MQQTAPKSMTVEEFLALPEDGVERWLIRGQLREAKPVGDARMTIRSRFHAEVTAAVAYVLNRWNRQQPKPRGRVYAGEAGVILPGDPPSTVGVDVAYVSAELAASQGTDTSLIRGVPTLVVEILSPSASHAQISEKVKTYLAAGVSNVWLVDTDFKTITVYQPQSPPQMFNPTHELGMGSDLPGC